MTESKKKTKRESNRKARKRLQKETKPTEKKAPERKISRAEGTLYGIGCGIGGSIFILLGGAIEIAGPGVLISLLLGGILIFFTALNYSELSTSLPLSGGSYNFSKEGLGGFLAFIIGFFLWVANVVTCVFSALAFSVVLETLFPFMNPFRIFIAIAMILLTVLTFLRTERFAIRTLVIATLILISIFGIFILSGLLIAPITNITHYNPAYLYSNISLFATFQGFALLFISYTSITSNLAYLNNDLKNPSKNIPFVNLVAITTTLFIYLSIAVVVLINLGDDVDQLAETPVLLAEVLSNIMGPAGFILMSVGAMISTIIAMNAALGSGTSVFQALARDKYIPEFFTKLNKKLNTPLYAILATSGLCFILVIFTDIDLAAEMTVFIYFFGLAFVNIAAVALRYKRKALDRPFKAPFFPYLPIIIGVSFLIFAFTLSSTAIVVGLIIAIFGISYYLLTIADRHSIVLTLAGIKLFAILILSLLIWVINNLAFLISPISDFEIFFTQVLLRLLITFGIIGIITVLFDIIPLREFVYFFIKKIDKEKVAISVSGGQIIELEPKKINIIHKINLFLCLIQIVASGFVFYLITLVWNGIISIDHLVVNEIEIFLSGSFDYFLVAALIIFGLCTLLGGLVSLYLNQELKSLGI